MARPAYPIEHLPRPISPSDLESLASLLIDAVDSGAAVSFLAPLAIEQSRTWWRKTDATCDARSIFLVARDDRGIVGTVQMHRAWAPNQPHRAEIAKLLVHRRARGLGLGRKLMEAVELAARRAGVGLLTLDAKQGGVADQLYAKLGWTLAGTIPRFALDTDGQTPHAAVIYYKHLPDH